jgi:hypothetical protein
MTTTEHPRVRRSLAELQNEYANGNKKPLEDVLRAWKGIKALPPDDPRSFFNLGHGEPFRGAGWGFGNDTFWGGYCNHGNVLFPTWHRVYLFKSQWTAAQGMQLLNQNIVNWLTMPTVNIPPDGKRHLVGVNAVLSRWAVAGCANCQTHLDVKSAFSLSHLPEALVSRATFDVKVIVKSSNQRALASNAHAAKKAARIVIR